MPYVYSDLARSVRLLLGEEAAGSDPMWLQECLRGAVDEVATRTRCLSRVWLLSLSGSPSSPQDWLLLPNALAGLKHVRVQSASGAFTDLSMAGGLIVEESALPADWRGRSAAAAPLRAVKSGNRLLLWPRLNYTLSNAVSIEGWAVPGVEWTAGDTAIARDEPFPLPDWCERATVFGAARDRALQTGDTKRYGALSERFDALLGHAQRISGGR